MTESNVNLKKCIYFKFEQLQKSMYIKTVNKTLIKFRQYLQGGRLHGCSGCPGAVSLFGAPISSTVLHGHFLSLSTPALRT